MAVLSGPDPIPNKKKPVAKKPVAKKRVQPKVGQVPGYQFTTNAESMLRNLPYGSEMLWRGKNAPSKNFRPEGFGSLTPKLVNGQWQVWGVANDPLKKYTDPVIAQMKAQQDNAQNWATNTVMPFASGALGGLQNAQNAAQAAFTNSMGGVAENVAQLASAPGPATPGLLGAGGLEAAQQAGLTTSQAQALTDQQSLEGAASALGFGAASQDQLAALNAQVLAMPNQFQQQRNEFLQSLVPLRAQIMEQRNQAEAERLRWNAELSEGRRQFNRQSAVEERIAGINADADVRQAEINALADVDVANANAAGKAATAQGRAINKQQELKAESRAKYRELKSKWAESAQEWLHGPPAKGTPRKDSLGNPVLDSDGNPVIDFSATTPKYSSAMEFMLAGVNAGLGVQDAYSIARDAGKTPTRKAVVVALRRRFKGKSSKWIQDRATKITGERAPREVQAEKRKNADTSRLSAEDRAALR